MIKENRFQFCFVTESVYFRSIILIFDDKLTPPAPIKFKYHLRFMIFKFRSSHLDNWRNIVFLPFHCIGSRWILSVWMFYSAIFEYSSRQVITDLKLYNVLWHRCPIFRPWPYWRICRIDMLCGKCGMLCQIFFSTVRKKNSFVSVVEYLKT